jgi:putative ubiquitin-RnfH superfamily antitoxin RatB of RatAB toxin-antitoxin module
MMDWAIETAAQLWGKPEHSAKEMDVEFGTSIADALRKAKADGMREAVSMMGGIFVNEFDAANQKVAREQAIKHADKIEKGQE